MADSKREFTRRSDRIEELVHRIEGTGDIATRAVAQELLQAVIELHGAAFERILDAIAGLPSGETALRRVTEDDLVSNVLSLHGIHPVAIEERVMAAIEKSRSYLQSHGGNVEFASIDDDNIVHVRLQGTCESCSSSPDTMRSHVEQAIFDTAPEVANVIADALPTAKATTTGLVILQRT